MLGIVEDKRAEVTALCEKYGVKRLDLFGSAAGDGFDPEASDLDFVVSFERRDPPELFDRYFGLEEDLEALFGRGVDVVMEGALLKNPDFAEGSRGSGSRFLRPERTPRTLQ
jgi:predicted nucleotidyltransferase